MTIDNTGYDLRNLFIGAEGTLGIITAACLKLFPLPKFRAIIAHDFHMKHLEHVYYWAYEVGPTIPKAAGIKLEGGEAMAETVAFLVARGIPVIGHVGLTPQAVNVLGGYGARGRSEAEASKIVNDAKALDQAGAFAIVIEGVIEPVAIQITQAVSAPTIGIGASAQCDGQVLVTEDMLGMFERVPRFVKRYEAIAETISGAAQRYAEEVRARTFPTVDQTYQPK